MKVHFAAASDAGRALLNNEDAFLADPSLGIFAVADGMGGHVSGELASGLAVEWLREGIVRAGREKFQALPEMYPPIFPTPASILVNALRLANQMIYETSREKKELLGMGTTIVAVYFPNHTPIAVHVGDSRLYHLRKNMIEQITEDHSLVWDLYKEGLITRDELSLHPQKNIITRALGLDPNVDIDLKPLRNLGPGDFLLLCSDGLSDLVRDGEMVELVRKRGAEDLNRACRDLIFLANARGGKDNITVLLIGIHDL